MENNHNHDHEHEEVELDILYVTFENEDGEEEEVETGIIGVFDVEDREYIALVVPTGEEDGELEEMVYLYRFTELDNEEVELENIETDEEYDNVISVYKELYEV